MNWDLQCENCGAHYVLSPGDNLNGAITNGMACEDCGGKRFYRNQPHPTTSDMGLRDMVDSDSQKDQGGNPLGEGTIMGDDGEQSMGGDTHQRDNYMHSHIAGFGQVDPYAEPDPDPDRGHGFEYHICPVCGSEGGIEPHPQRPHWACINCGQKFEPPDVQRLQEEYKQLLGSGQHDAARKKFDEIQHVQNMVEMQDPQQHMEPQGFQHPDPWMDNEPGATVYPESWNYLAARQNGTHTIPHHWGHKSIAVDRSLDMEPYEMDGLFDLPNDYRSLPYRQAGSLWNSIKGVVPSILPAAEDIGQAGLAAAAPVDQEIPGLDVASDAAAASEIGGLLGDAGSTAADSESGMASKVLDMAKSKGLSTLKSQGMNQIKQRLLPAGGISGLMKGALGVGAGGAAGAAAGGSGVQSVPGAPGAGPEAVGPGIQTPGQGAWYGSVDLPMFLLADAAHLETSDSIKSVGEQNGDDPQKVDQKEFNDGDQSPSNHKNPNNEDSGASGEDGVREKTEGYGFGPNSPGIDRAMMLLPLILHYFQSDESGENDPLIKGLHDMLEQENPGYLQQQHPDGHQIVQEIIQLHKPHPGEEAQHAQHAAGVNMQAPGGMVPQKWTQPGGAMQPNQVGARCPNCGGVTNPDGSCPQCGTSAQQPGLPSTPSRVGNSIGPQTPEQKAIVVQYLIDHGLSDLAPEVETNPMDPRWADILAKVQRKPNVPPIPDPSQVTPLVPQPSQPGGMPVPDPGAANGPASGAPMQPMSSIDALVWPIEMLHEANGPAPRCPHCHSGSTTPRPGQEGMSFECHSCGKIFERKDVDTIKYKGAAAAPRCPKCKSGSTFPRIGQEGISFECHSCHHIWDRDDLDTIKYKGAALQIEGLVDVPNPNLNRDDTAMAWKDTSGKDLIEGQEYEIRSAAFNTPTYATVLKVHPNHLDLKISGSVASMLNPDENSPDFQIPRKEAQINDYQFTPVNAGQQDMDDRNTEQPTGTPGLDHIPEQQPTTDETMDSFPNTTVAAVVASDDELESEDEPDHCVKCGSTMLDHMMRDEVTTLHECVPCGHAWETKDTFQGHEASVDLSWVMEANDEDDFYNGYERAKAMREAGTQSRNLSDVVSRDERYQQIRERLRANAMAREAGKHYTPSEKRALINERGRARNLEDLDLTNTHYDVREDYTGRANGMNVREDDLFLGI